MTSTVLTRVSDPAVFVAKAAAGLATVSALLHLSMVAHLVRAPSGVLMLFLAAVCAACARALWCRPDVRAWTMMGVCSSFMIMAHGVFMGAGHPGASTHSTHASMGHAMTSGGVDGGHNSVLMTAAMVIAIVEVVLAIGMSLKLRR